MTHDCCSIPHSSHIARSGWLWAPPVAHRNSKTCAGKARRLAHLRLVNGEGAKGRFSRASAFSGLLAHEETLLPELPLPLQPSVLVGQHGPRVAAACRHPGTETPPPQSCGREGYWWPKLQRYCATQKCKKLHLFATHPQILG